MRIVRSLHIFFTHPAKIKGKAWKKLSEVYESRNVASKLVKRPWHHIILTLPFTTCQLKTVSNVFHILITEKLIWNIIGKLPLEICCVLYIKTNLKEPLIFYLCVNDGNEQIKYHCEVAIGYWTEIIEACTHHSMK